MRPIVLTLNKRTNSIVVRSRSSNILVNSSSKNIQLRHVGRTGAPGKDSIGISDRNYVQFFNVSDIVYVTHNLNKKPAVSVVDSAGTEVEGDVEYVDNNNIIVRFSAQFSGQVFCN